MLLELADSAIQAQLLSYFGPLGLAEVELWTHAEIPIGHVHPCQLPREHHRLDCELAVVCHPHDYATAELTLRLARATWREGLN